MTGYVAQCLIWSLAGFILGWLLGRLGRGVQEIEEAIMPQQARRPWRSWLPAERILGVILVLLATLTMVTTVIALGHLQQVTRCQARFNETYGTALAHRFESAAAERAAQRELIVTIARSQTAPKNQAEAMTTTALQQYLTALDSADQDRQSNPLPDDLRCS